ncbi:MAG: Unknown protein [uncultured Sulfurovum sp.]|uniref:Uncharacterized protein n=1 Tax=uncultured Sulfurovum sp. TaxID=269237 RepID=A0A6S6TT52_9BACT|nr:MAG: Unknown protein [uncultured Sulfurovum sp.]
MKVKLTSILGVLLFFSVNLLFSDEEGDIFVPYDDEGFYAGSIIILFIIYFLTPFITLLIIGGITYAIAPFVFQEFKRLIQLYDDFQFKEAFFKHFIHFLLFTPIAVLLLYFAYSLENTTLYLFALFIFLYSSFIGFYVTLYFIYATYTKRLKRIFISLILGAGVFLFFASSAYVVFEPIYKKFHNI